MNADNETLLRASFFDFTRTVDQPEALSDAARYLADGVLTLRAGKIVSLQSWSSAAHQVDHRQVTDLRGKLIVPGFIDTHIHYPQTEMMGAFGEQLLT